MVSYSNFKTAVLTSTILLITNSLLYARFTANLVSPTGKIPSPRADHSSVVINTQDGYFLIVYGGRNGKTTLNDIWTYGVNQNSWEILTPLDSELKNDPPPPMYGAASGYRYVEGFIEPFLYITLGTGDGQTKFFNEMWAMEFRNFTWKKVQVDGEIPSARYSTSGGLELHARHDGSIQSELIVTHGFGVNGPLSDAYRCQFDEKNPYRATWIRIHGPISQYSLFRPHPVYQQGSTFTAKRDIVMFGGCYSYNNFGGYCPSNAAWQLQKDHDGRDFASPDGDDGYRYTWARLSSEPATRIGAAMSQGLSSFEGVYQSWSEIAVLFSGINQGVTLNSSQLISDEPVTNSEISLYSTKSMKWIREEVEFIGDVPEIEKGGRFGSSFDIAFDTRITKKDVPNEFYLLFGGHFEDASFTNTMLKISFDPYAQSNVILGAAKSWSKPQVHGILMFIGFGIMTPIASFLLRYLQEKRSLSVLQTWHMAIKLFVLVIAWIGYGVVRYNRTRKSTLFLHATIGYMILILSSIQPIFNVIIRALSMRKKRKNNSAMGDPMKSARSFSLWKLLYKVAGLLILILGLTNITLGVFVLTSPLLLWVHWIVYIIVIVIITFWMELTLSTKPEQEYEFTDRNSFRVRSSPPPCNFIPESVSTPAPALRRYRTRQFTSVRQIFTNNNRGKRSETSQAFSGSSVPYFR